LRVSSIASKDFFVVNVNDNVSKVISSIEKTGFLGGVVVDDNQDYMGVIHAKEIIRLKSDPRKTKVQNILKRAPVLSEEDSLFRAVKLILEVDTRILPVGIENRVKKVVYDVDVIKAFLGNSIMEEQVDKIMTRDVITIDEKTSIAKAIKTLAENKISHLPIMKDGKLVGIVSTHDIAAKILFARVRVTTGERVGERIKSLSIPISNLMSYPVLTVRKGTSISDCARMMIEKGVGSLVVIDNRSIIGIVTRKDILEYISASEPKETKTYFQIIGEMPQLTEREKILMEKNIKSFLWKVERRYGEGSLFIHIKRVKGIRKPVTTVRARLLTDSGTYYASHNGYNLIECLQVLFQILERSIVLETDLARREERLEKKIVKYFPELFE